MAKVAAVGPVHPSNALKFGVGGGSKVTATTVKRKTPSELRGEQLKRKNTTQPVDESSAPIGGSMSNGVFPGSKISDVSKNPRYVDTRVDELFPVRKNSIRLNLISRKENVKESFPAEQSGSIKKSSVPSAFPAENQQQLKFPESFLPSTVSGKDCATKTCSTSQRCNENTFRSVTELSLGGVDAHGLSTIDMDKALRGLATHEHQVASAKIAESSEPDGGSRSKIFSSELHVPCKMTPLDLTMKTNIRVVSASSINWFHRLINCGTGNVVARFTSSNCSTGQKMTCFSEMNSVSQAVNHWSLHSWMYPQSPLPPSVISALTLSASTGGQLDFLSERQLAWQDSFRSLYYMLRKNVCSIFYVCTAQFVVMFTSSYSEENCVCNAYISQSTRGLRSSLKEHDVSFSMPLCHSKLEELSTEELLELSEIEKQNLGQTRRRGAMSDVDNRPQSLLAFTGNKNVHSLYDFLLNYRYFLTSLTGVDVPVLYSPIPFENAAFTAPEVLIDRQVQLPHHSRLSSSAVIGEIPSPDLPWSWFATRLADIKENSKFKSLESDGLCTNLKELVDTIKQKYGLKYVYMWHALAGYWGGVLPTSETLKKYNPKIVYPVQSPGNLGNIRDIALDSLEKYGVGVIDAQKIYDFYNDLHNYLASCGVDGVKVDVQNLMETLGSVFGGRVSLTKKYHEALDESIERNFKDNNLICCMSHNSDSIYRFIFYPTYLIFKFHQHQIMS